MKHIDPTSAVHKVLPDYDIELSATYTNKDTKRKCKVYRVYKGMDDAGNLGNGKRIYSHQEKRFITNPQWKKAHDVFNSIIAELKKDNPDIKASVIIVGPEYTPESKFLRLSIEEQ